MRAASTIWNPNPQNTGLQRTYVNWVSQMLPDALRARKFHLRWIFRCSEPQQDDKNHISRQGDKLLWPLCYVQPNKHTQQDQSNKESYPECVYSVLVKEYITHKPNVATTDWIYCAVYMQGKGYFGRILIWIWYCHRREQESLYSCKSRYDTHHLIQYMFRAIAL